MVSDVVRLASIVCLHHCDERAFANRTNKETTDYPTDAQLFKRLRCHPCHDIGVLLVKLFEVVPHYTKATASMLEEVLCEFASLYPVASVRVAAVQAICCDPMNGDPI